MLRGQLWATSDINMVNQALMQGFKVIFLGDPISIDPAYKDVFVIASSFVPDYQTMVLHVEGNEQGFAQMYISSLNSRAATEMMTVILAALYNGTGIMFYLPPEASGLNYIQYLLSFIKSNYGIETQTKSTQFSFDLNYSNRIIEILYLNNFVPAQEFLLVSTALDEFTLRKLVSELHPMVKNPKDIKQVIAWFDNYKNELIKANKPLVNGIQYAGEVSDYAVSGKH